MRTWSFLGGALLGGLLLAVALVSLTGCSKGPPPTPPVFGESTCCAAPPATTRVVVPASDPPRGDTKTSPKRQRTEHCACCKTCACDHCTPAPAAAPVPVLPPMITRQPTDLADYEGLRRHLTIYDRLGNQYNPRTLIWQGAIVGAVETTDTPNGALNTIRWHTVEGTRHEVRSVGGNIYLQLAPLEELPPPRQLE